MSGHNKWSQIKNKKGVADVKRGKVFSKMLRAISIAAKSEPNPQFNPRLRSAIETAKEYLVPLDNIERAINKASEQKNLSEMVIEAYGPEGSAIIIEAITDNTNRTISEVKKILNDHDAKFANQGSVLWAFEKTTNNYEASIDSHEEWKPGSESLATPPKAECSEDGQTSTAWKAKFPQKISDDAKVKIEGLIEALDEHDDVQNIFTNIE
ncbi:MAG: YebC/PmpR family DNA-binding transcriptional regulator [Patescibacteria group bacterium]